MFKSSIFSGIVIGIGCIAYCNATNNVIGALLFSFALLSICTFKSNLFTGKCGLLYKWRIKVKQLLCILLGNVFGVASVALLYYVNLSDSIVQLSLDKASMRLHTAFIESVLCGVLMNNAVRVMQNICIASVSICMLCVMAFLLSGFEHCIANIYYLTIAALQGYDICSIIIVLCTCILGNLLGAVVHEYLFTYKIST